MEDPYVGLGSARMDVLRDVRASVQWRNLPFPPAWRGMRETLPLLQDPLLAGISPQWPMRSGVVSFCDVPAGRAILIYGGEVMEKPHPTSDYYVSVVRGQHCLYIDALYHGTVARFVNHSCQLNCDLEVMITDNLICPFIVSN